MIQKVIILMVFFGFLIVCQVSTANTKTDCQPVEKKNIKVEGFISKKFRKDQKKISKEFSKMGNTRTALRPFPMGNTSDVVAIGRCVPAYIAQHVLKTAQKYTSGVGSLVVQDFLHVHWIGIGTTMFDEPSQQKVSPEQLYQLLNPELGDQKFHDLYRKFSKQSEMVPYFGLEVPNAKIPGASTILSP